MDIAMIFLKYLCLVIAIIYTFSNFGTLIFRKDDIPAIKILLMALGIAGYLMLELDFGY